MKGPQSLQRIGQSLWLDNITRTMLDDGSLEALIATQCVTGLTSNPSIFQAALVGTDAYDPQIARRSREGVDGEALFVELALADLRRAADLLHATHEASGGVDGWVSMEISPLLSQDAVGSVAAAARIFAQADRPNLFIKIPGTPEGLKAIEESIFQGIPVNVTLLFSPEQYLAAAAAYWRGLERRSRAGLHLRVASVASLFVSRWDVAANGRLPAALKNRLGIVVARRTHRRYREALASGRWERLAQDGAVPQRLLWASTGVKDPSADPTLYVQALALPQTINTLPSQTLRAVASHAPFAGALVPDDDVAEAASAPFEAAGIALAELGIQLQQDGEAAFRVSWEKILQLMATKVAAQRAASLPIPGGA